MIDAINHLKERISALEDRLLPIKKRLKEIAEMKLRLADKWIIENMDTKKYNDARQNLDKEEARLLAIKPHNCVLKFLGIGNLYLISRSRSALCIEPCKKGIETRFFRTTALVNRLSEAKKNGTELFGFLYFSMLREHIQIERASKIKNRGSIL
jgi:hypothetical protein